jgi:Transglycosylase SLT domain
VSLRAALAGLAVAAATLAAAPAQAELWGYVDGHGMAHFAHHRVDARYSLVLGDTTRATPVPGKRHDPQRLLTWMEIAPEVKALQPVLREAAAAHGVDADLLKAVIATESGFDGRLVSPKGAIGLMQITPATADRYAGPGEARVPAAQRLRDARINIHTGARMLADLQRRHGAIEVVLAAWNAGEGNVRRHGGKVPPFAETRAHVHMVLELYWALLQRGQSPRAMTLVAQAR